MAVILKIEICVEIIINESIVMHSFGSSYGKPSLVNIPNGIAVIPTKISARANEITNMYIA